MLEKFIDNDVMGFERVLRDIEKILLLILLGYLQGRECCGALIILYRLLENDDIYATQNIFSGIVCMTSLPVHCSA